MLYENGEGADMDRAIESHLHGSAVVDPEWQGLLVPDLITPEQYGDRTRAEVTDRPEARIMLAVLADAIATYRRGVVCRTGSHARRPFREVLQWLESTDDAPLYSFERICSTLRFDAAAIREGLERWRERQVPTNTPPKRLAFRRSNERRFIIGSSVRDPKVVRRREHTAAPPAARRREQVARPR
jgi:hypothetical protein